MVLAVWLAMGGTDDDLMRKGYDEYIVKMRDEPSDDVSEWLGVIVEGGKVTSLNWPWQGLMGAIPTESGALSALQVIPLYINKLSGSI